MVRKPNLSLAESAARELNNSLTSFPIDLLEIAENNEISVVSDTPEKEGISGCIVFANGAALIYYSKAIQNAGFQNFTIAHELGHYFIPGHPEEIEQSGGTHLSASEFTGKAPIEREADHFAAHLLMPTKLSRELLRNEPRGLRGILRLSEAAIASVTSAAIRAVQIDPYPLAIIKSANDRIQFSILTPTLRSFGHIRSHPSGYSLPIVNDPKNSVLGDWFDTAPHGVSICAETINLGTYGKLTVLTPHSPVEDPYEEDDEDSDEAVAENWAIRFKGQKYD